ESLALEVLIELVDGRQLLPAVRSPGRPEEDEHDLAAQVGEVHRLPLEVGQREGWRRLGRLVGHDSYTVEVGWGGDGARRDQRHDEACQREQTCHARRSFSALRTSSGSRRSSGLGLMFCHLRTPFLSMMK